MVILRFGNVRKFRFSQGVANALYCCDRWFYRPANDGSSQVNKTNEGIQIINNGSQMCYIQQPLDFAVIKQILGKKVCSFL